MPVRPDADEDRRRSTRFHCGGRAEIVCLPSGGVIVPGTIRDLSLHGCHIDTSSPIAFGARAEILVRVNSSAFRAVGEVRAMRGRSGAGVEFAHMSAGGKDLLASMIADLARVQALMTRLKSTRREMDMQLFKKELEQGKLQASLLRERPPALQSLIVPDENTEDHWETDTAAADVNDRTKNDRTSKDLSAAVPRFVVTVDVFG